MQVLVIGGDRALHWLSDSLGQVLGAEVGRLEITYIATFCCEDEMTENLVGLVMHRKMY